MGQCGCRTFPSLQKVLLNNPAPKEVPDPTGGVRSKRKTRFRVKPKEKSESSFTNLQSLVLGMGEIL